MIVITDRKQCQIPLTERLEMLCPANPEMVILREKDLNQPEYEELAADCLKICEKYNIPLSVNSNLEAAEKLDICRIHLPIHLMRIGVPPSFTLVGVSVHSVEEAVEAEGLGADYLIAGHVYCTTCKSTEPRGTDFLKSICDSVDIPVYAVGGVSPDNYREILEKGASGGCCMSSMMRSRDPANLITKMNFIRDAFE